MRKSLFHAVLALAMLLVWPLGTAAQVKSAKYQGGVRVEKFNPEAQPAKKGKKVSPDIISFSRTQKDQPRTLQTGQLPMRAAAQPGPMLALGDGTTIYGSLAYTSAWTSYDWGIYSFKAGADLSSTKVCNIYGDPNGGGTIVGDKYVYTYFIYTAEMGFTFTTLCTQNMKTGEQTKVQQIYPEQSQITYALAYDRTTDVCYALSYMTKFIDDDKLVQKYVPCLSTIDLTTGVVTPIAELPKMSFLAITPGGEMFAASTGSSSRLFRINKTTGAYTEVGPTGITPSNYTQAATFDALTGKLYWACTHVDGTSALYEVNTSTGAASKIASFKNDEEYTGLYVPEPEVAEAAPAKADGFTVDFAGGSLSGEVKGKAPLTTAAGAQLSGNVTVKLTVDRSKTETKTVAPGAAFSFSQTLTEGIHNFELVVANAAGDGPRLAQAKYVGIDAPAAPANVKLAAAADGKAHLTWTAPAIGMNDGYIDPAQLTYRIVRQPGNTLVAEAATGTSYDDDVTSEPDNYYYELTAYCGGRQGLTATSNKGVFGSGSSLPYEWAFDSEDAFNLWTVIDANNDFNDLRYGKWQYGATLKLTGEEAQSAVYKWSSNDADDWLISPPFKVEKGKKYEVTYKVKTRGQEERLQLAAGDLNTVDRMSPMGSVQKLTNKEYTEKKEQFTASADGNYFVGFHALSQKNRYYLILKSVSVDEVPNNDAPAAVENLTVTADPEGALKATVAFAAPQKTKQNTALQSIQKIDVYHGNETTPVYTFSAAAPGQQMSWTETVSAYGTYTYRVVASNAAGAGDKAVASAYVGPDVAKAVENLSLNEVGGKPVITWQAPTKGVNGGYVSADKMTYRIIRQCDHQAETKVLAARHQGTTFTDNGLDPAKSQYYVAYEVIPVTEAGEGESATSGYIIYGDPYADGFAESFPNRTTQTGPWTVDPKENHHWELRYNGDYPTCEPADKDGGLIVYVASEANPNTSSRLISPKISVKDMVVPVLKFCVYHYTQQSEYEIDDTESNTIAVSATTSGGDEKQLMAKPIEVSNGYTGWLMYTVDLRQLKTADWFQLNFTGTCKDAYGYDIALDMITVTNENDFDLSAYAFAGPTKVNAGRDAKYTLTVENVGFDAVSNYDVQFLRDGQVVETQYGKQIESGEFQDYTYTASTKEADQGKTFSYSAKIVCSDDRVAGNNLSRTVKTLVDAPLYPEVYSVNAQKVDDHKTFIFWNKPDALRITDDFESYPAWAIQGVGNYTLTDVDGKETYSFADMQFTNANAPKAYIVFNPDALGASLLPEWKAKSGSQVMAAFAANGSANDDWLISPQVHGGEQVKFFARTAGDMWSIYGYETFEVLYSSTTTAVDQFKALSGSVETTTDWKEYTYDLPENAKYFAVRCTSNDKFVFYLDDLSYVERVDGNNFNVAGYNVYRNGELIQQLAADKMNCFDENLADGVYTYQVAAVYAGGEAGKSREATVVIGNASGIDGVAADAAVPTVADVYTTDGKLVGKGINPMLLKKGIYVVNGKKTAVGK